MGKVEESRVTSRLFPILSKKSGKVGISPTFPDLPRLFPTCLENFTSSGRLPRFSNKSGSRSGKPPRTCKIFEASREKSRQIRKSRGNLDFSRLFAQNREKLRCNPTFLDFSRYFPTFPGVFDLKRTEKLGENLDFPRFCPGNSRTVISTRSRFVGKSG